MAPRELDARGWLCPIPVLRAQKILRDMKAGDVLVVSVTDPNACRDFDIFCQESGTKLLSRVEQGSAFAITIQK